jgi:hypothetical protein
LRLNKIKLVYMNKTIILTFVAALLMQAITVSAQSIDLDGGPMGVRRGLCLR